MASLESLFPQEVLDRFMEQQGKTDHYHPQRQLKPVNYPSTFPSTLERAFPQGVNYTGGFEPKPQQKAATLPIDLILITGAYTSEAAAVCNRFANDFGIFHLNVNDYLHDLDKQGLQPLDPALCMLHPESLKGMLETGREVPIYFLTRILRHRVDSMMKDVNCSKVLLSTFPEKPASVVKLAKEVARIGAIFHFQETKRKDSRDITGEYTEMKDAAEASAPKWKLGDRPVLSVRSSGDSEEGEECHQELLAAVAHEAFSKPQIAD